MSELQLHVESTPKHQADPYWLLRFWVILITPLWTLCKANAINYPLSIALSQRMTRWMPRCLMNRMVGDGRKSWTSLQEMPKMSRWRGRHWLRQQFQFFMWNVEMFRFFIIWKFMWKIPMINIPNVKSPMRLLNMTSTIPLPLFVSRSRTDPGRAGQVAQPISFVYAIWTRHIVKILW